MKSRGEHQFSWFSGSLSVLRLAMSSSSRSIPSPNNKLPISQIHSRYHYSPLLTRLLLFLLISFLYFLCWPHPPPASLSSSDMASVGAMLSLPSNSALFLASNDDPYRSSSCQSGHVYVYNLPPQFNAHILFHCSSLLPWFSLCPALSNNGLGVSLDLPSWMGTGYWYATNQFSNEVLFHARMLLHPCRTLDPELATAFYVPFYIGLDLGKYLWVDSSSKERDFLSCELVNWLTDQRYWKRRGGWDHFLTIGRITWDFRRSDYTGWGSSFSYMPGVENMTRLTIERSPWDDQEMGIPYPTSYHPRTEEDVLKWQQIVSTSNRNTLFSFAGAPRSQFPNDFRGILMEECRQSNSCRIVDCSASKCEHPLATLELFMDSVFCLQPRGDSYTRRSIFDSMLVGCIPVFFWRRTAYDQYEWHLPVEETSYSVFISKEDIESGRRVEDVLRAVPEQKIREMQGALIQLVPTLTYGVPGARLGRFKDAFDVAVQGVLDRMMKRQGMRVSDS